MLGRIVTLRWKATGSSIRPVEVRTVNPVWEVSFDTNDRPLPEGGHETLASPDPRGEFLDERG